MKKKAKSILPKRLSTSLTVTLALLTIATALAVGIPAFWIINKELEDQAWSRVADGASITAEFLASEQGRLLDLAQLTSERPTLVRLISTGDEAALAGYLNTYQLSADLDVLVIRSAAGEILTESNDLAINDCQLLSPEAYFQLDDAPSPQLFVLACAPIFETGSAKLIGFVTLGMRFSIGYLQIIDDHTGFRQSVVIAGARTVTSMTGEPEALSPIILEDDRDREKRSFQLSSRYYSTLLPITGKDGTTLAALEVALPVDLLFQARRQAVLTLVSSILVIALIAAVTGILLARQIAHPVQQLTTAIQNKGHFAAGTPIEVDGSLYEMQILGQAFEESRANTQQMVEELTAAKAWLETLVQSVMDGIVTYDLNGKVTSFSKGAQVITGWKAAEAIGEDISKILKPVEEIGDTLMKLPAKGEVRQVNIMTRQGKETTLSTTGAQLSAKEQAVVIRDITEEKAVQNLRAYFLANITHEFRTPLAALKASVELLLTDVETMTSAEISELLNSIHYSISGLETLIDNLLESMSIEARRFRIRRKPTDLQEVLADAVRVVKPLLDRRGQPLVIEQNTPFIEVFLDPQRFSQVLVNLLSNASKFSPLDSEILVALEIGKDGVLHGRVTDKGPGISPEDQQNLFRQFIRLDSTNKPQYGVGLGLSVVKTIIEEHGGQVGVENRPGGGAIFWFTIPDVRRLDESPDR